ncbi:MAG: hypothetical protein K0Q93_3094, partial [Nocardioidaceae bacterium]|nr:hypothetical protein [Nocardioidaceae bacterium]
MRSLRVARQCVTALRATSVVVAGLLVATALPAAAAAAPGAGDPSPVASLSGQARVGPPVPMTDSPRGLKPQADWGREIEPLATYQPQLSCAAAPMAGMTKLLNLVLDTYDRGSNGGAIRSCATGGQSEHKEGRAWDWMLDAGNRGDRRVAGDFLSWLLKTRGGEQAAMARRLGVMYVIYNRKIWATYSPGWRDYTGGDPHTSHIHVSMSWNGGRGLTSFWKGSVSRWDFGPCSPFSDQLAAVVATKRAQTSPCRDAVPSPRGSSRPVAWLGNSGDQVRKAQQLLSVSASGQFGTTTRSRVLDFQRRHDLPRTGALDKPTWASLEPSTRTLMAPRWSPAEAVAWAKDNGSPTLGRRSAGKAVYAAQVALRMPRGL